MTSSDIISRHSKHGDVDEQDRTSVRASAADKKTWASVAEVSITDNNNAEAQDDANLQATQSSRLDAEGMKRMGKEQQLVRKFRLLSIAAFVCLATATWEIGLFTIGLTLTDGGNAGLLYTSIWNFVCFAPVYLSMAEMASMAPIAGAQYHWVSEFAPESCQRFLSYITGWTSTLAFQSGNAVGAFLVGSLVQTIILINNENYGFPAWHCTLLAFGAMAIAYIGSVYGAKVLPYWQTTVFVVHIVGYFIYIVPIWVNAPRATHEQVWKEFTNEGGWNSMVLSVLVGQLTGIGQQLGIDTAAHMAEETRDAAELIPRVMLAVFGFNFVLFFPAFLTVCYHVPSIREALDDSTTYPAIYVLRQSMSPVWVTVILVIIVLLNVASNIVYLTAVTRDLFAFARDKGVPFSGWLSTVHPTRKIPQNAATLSCMIASCLALIYIGSPVAFFAIVSLCQVALLQCYCLSIGCILWRRIYYPETLPPTSFSLGRWGIPINGFAVVYSFWSFFWCFWPESTPVTASNFNWSSPIFCLVLIIALIYFYFTARFHYVGPVTEVEGRKLHAR